MMRTKKVALLIVGALILFAISFTPEVGARERAIPARWANCKAVNARFPQGVGRVGAHDKTSGEPVTTFRRSNRLYREATRYHPGLDRDKDGIACEKR
jgi:Excalibur calcium-binding domain